MRSGLVLKLLQCEFKAHGKGLEQLVHDALGDGADVHAADEVHGLFDLVLREWYDRRLMVRNVRSFFSSVSASSHGCAIKPRMIPAEPISIK